MKHIIYKYAKFPLLLVLLILTYYFLKINFKYEQPTYFTPFHPILNTSQSVQNLQQKTTISTFSSNHTIINNTSLISTITTTTTTTSNPSLHNTIDPAEVLVERAPSSSQYHHNLSNITLVVFVFHTRHSVLANLQLYLIRQFATNLVALELFIDGIASKEMEQVARIHNAGLNSFLPNMHKKSTAPSDKNADVVNWAIRNKGKNYLRNGSALLLLDGDVFPLSYFDSITLLNSRDIVCRKHPATYSRFCWIGFICLSPQLYNTIDDFSVSVLTRRGQWHDAGGETLEYLLKYENTSFSWMKETILLHKDKELFWGAMNNDISWIEKNFDRCDKCGPEIFFSPFNNSDAVFYHMISGASEWRFQDQNFRRRSLYNSILESPYGFYRTNKTNRTLSISELTASVRKIQKMRLIPFHGNLTCGSICRT